MLPLHHHLFVVSAAVSVPHVVAAVVVVVALAVVAAVTFAVHAAVVTVSVGLDAVPFVAAPPASSVVFPAGSAVAAVDDVVAAVVGQAYLRRNQTRILQEVVRNYLVGSLAAVAVVVFVALVSDIVRNELPFVSNRLLPPTPLSAPLSRR